MEAAIEAAELHKTYPPAVKALDGVSLTVGAGTIFALLGPNGAGKSTTVRVLCTLTRPDSGSARVAGIDVLRDPVAARRAIGVVGQKHGADPEATGRENLILQGEFYGIRGRELRERVTQALERFNLADAADRQAKTYSGGMQRRLDIAMGLLHRPRALFLDEPTTGLDPEARVDMWHEIRRLAADEGMTVLITTHYMEEADKLASQLAIIDRGRVVDPGPARAAQGRAQGRHDPGGTRGFGGRGGSRGARAGRRVDQITLDGPTLRAQARDGSAAIPAVLAALEAHGVQATSVTVARPTLDDVYLHHAGREFHRSTPELEEVAA